LEIAAAGFLQDKMPSLLPSQQHQMKPGLLISCVCDDLFIANDGGYSDVNVTSATV